MRKKRFEHHPTLPFFLSREVCAVPRLADLNFEVGGLLTLFVLQNSCKRKMLF